MIRSLLLILLFVFTVKVRAQTTLTIVGTLHQESPKINADTLYNLLVKLKPDVFLLEIDSLDRLDHLNADDAKGNENVAVTRYRQAYPSVKIEPFDMIDKVAFLKREHYWDKIAVYNKALDSLITGDRLDSLSQLILEALTDVAASTRYFDSKLADLRAINSKEATRAIELRNKWEYDKLRLLTNRDNRLSKFVNYSNLALEYWNIRNKAMANNILRIVRQNSGKRLIVFVGNNHRYYLLNEIASQQEALKFVLKEYWEL